MAHAHWKSLDVLPARSEREANYSSLNTNRPALEINNDNEAPTGRS